MARRTSTEARESSLELLLDTICNTFGGVLFISILVIVLVNMSSRQIVHTPQKSRAQQDLELLQLQQDLEQARAQLETLNETASRMEAIKAQFTNQKSIDLAQKLHESQLEISQTVITNTRGGEETAELQQKINQINEQLEQQTQELRNRRKELENISVKLKGVVTKNSRESRLPTAQKQAGEPDAYFIIKQGVLCDLDNPAESRQSTEGGIRFVDPVLSAGLKISETQSDTSPISAKLAARGIPGRHLIRVWVSPDSHTQWNLVREALVKRGNQYELILLPEKERLSYGASSRVMRSQ
ncbi:MAG: hypothetical protein KDA77_03980 [Planctomycetaceae bacterium]|nr:hypothetical protein [Planctomycetaceae bacterium]